MRSESIYLEGGSGQIEASILYPDNHDFIGTAVISHPHPLMGGTMDNKVVQTLAKSFAQAGWRSIRYNFRGVGTSDGIHDNGIGELEDLLMVVDQTAHTDKPLALAGFSFGAFVTTHAIARLQAKFSLEKIVLIGTAAGKWELADIPRIMHSKCLIIHGENDDVIPVSDCLAWVRPQNLVISIVPQGGHFFHGQLTILKQLVLQHLK